MIFSAITPQLTLLTNSYYDTAYQNYASSKYSIPPDTVVGGPAGFKAVLWVIGARVITSARYICRPILERIIYYYYYNYYPRLSHIIIIVMRYQEVNTPRAGRLSGLAN